jgi:hypothetical protein
VPNKKTIGPLPYSFAKAAKNMPSLRKAVLWTGLEFDPTAAYGGYKDLQAEIHDTAGDEHFLGWGIIYTRPGGNINIKNHPHRDCNSTELWSHEEGCALRQFWWLTQDWRPDATLYTLFDKIGQFEHGNEAIHYWPSDQEHNWHLRYTFEGSV